MWAMGIMYCVYVLFGEFESSEFDKNRIHCNQKLKMHCTHYGEHKKFWPENFPSSLPTNKSIGVRIVRKMSLSLWIGLESCWWDWLNTLHTSLLPRDLWHLTFMLFFGKHALYTTSHLKCNTKLIKNCIQNLHTHTYVMLN